MSESGTMMAASLQRTIPDWRRKLSSSVSISFFSFTLHLLLSLSLSVVSPNSSTCNNQSSHSCVASLVVVVSHFSNASMDLWVLFLPSHLSSLYCFGKDI